MMRLAIGGPQYRPDQPFHERMGHGYVRDRLGLFDLRKLASVLQMPDKAQPGRTICSCFGSIVFREHAADDVFVDIDAKGMRNLLCDAGTANTGVAALELDDRVDEFLRWSFWSGAPMTSRREKPPVFAFLERLVESQQGSGLQDDRELRDSACWNEQ